MWLWDAITSNFWPGLMWIWWRTSLGMTTWYLGERATAVMDVESASYPSLA